MVSISLRCRYDQKNSENFSVSARMNMQPLKGEIDTRIKGTGAEAGDIQVVSCLARYRRSEPFLRAHKSTQTRNRVT